MAHGTDHHLQEAEHVQHQAHNPFDRRVAMTMAILAALLAGVTLQSHRTHNQTLLFQNHAQQQMIKSNDSITEESNKWGYYQAKKNRQYLYEACGDLLAVGGKDANKPEAAQQAEKLIDGWKSRASRYETDSKQIEGEARDLHEHAKEYEHEAEKFHQKAEEIHHKADRFDLGHLGLDLALVFCSVAVLTKQRGFWITGIIVGAAGALVALSAYLAH